MIVVSANPSANKPRQLPPAGTHVARCFQLVDLGTHEKTTYLDDQGKPKRVHEIRISFELPTELAVFDEAKGEQPFTVHETWTLSLHEKAKMRKALEAWRNKPFTDEELRKFDLGKLLGQPCMLSVVHKKGVGVNADKTYANVSAIMALPKSTTCPPQVNPSVEYSIAQHNQATFDALPQFLRDLISSSDEFKARSQGDDGGATVEAVEDLANAPEIPF